MKKILFALALFGMLSCTKTVKEKYEDVACGGYGKESAITAEDSAVWTKATASRPDLKEYVLVSVRRQVVAGMNYDFTCRDKNGETKSVKIYAPLPENGDTVVTYPAQP